VNAARRYAVLGKALWSYWRKRTVLDYLPIRMWIEPTNRCNLRCRMCPQSTARQEQAREGFMEFGLFTKIVDEACRFVHDVNLHHTGEALLHRDLPAMAQYAHEKGLVTRLHSNAGLLTEETAEALIDSGLDLISFSFDGYDKETYESIRRQGNFEKTLANIRRFLEIKKRKGSRTPHTVFEVIDVFPEAREGRREFERQFDGLPLDEFIVKKPHNWAGTYAAQDDRRAAPRDFTRCTFPWYALVVFWDGRVDPCPQDFFGDCLLGDLTRQTIAEVWNGEPMVRLRERMAGRDVSGIVPCGTCDMLERESFAGIPTLNLKAFLKESLFGYRSDDRSGDSRK